MEHPPLLVRLRDATNAHDVERVLTRSGIGHSVVAAYDDARERVPDLPCTSVRILLR